MSKKFILKCQENTIDVLFRDKLTLIRSGDSGLGKTYLFKVIKSAFKSDRLVFEDGTKIKSFLYLEGGESLKKNNIEGYDMVVLDDADIILEQDNIDDIIYNNDTMFIITARDSGKLSARLSDCCELCDENNRIFLRYFVKGD